MSARRLGVMLTHPVQYFAPLFRELAGRGDLDVQVYFAHRPTPEEQGEGFGVAFEWDVDVLDGYAHEFLENVATKTRGSGFAGFDTPSIRDRVRAGGFDAFLVFGWHARSYWQTFAACRSARVPVLVRGDSQLTPRDGGVRGAVKALAYRRFVSRFAVCLATGSRSEEYFRHFGARAVERSPHFVDNEFFAREAAKVGGAAARASFGIAPDAFVLLHSGKLGPRKRPVDLIRAAGRASAQGRPITLLFAGDGPLRAECEAAADGERASGLRVLFAGFMNQSELPRAYAAADAIALCSDDTWGLVVNEAMACGVPAVVSEAVGCGPDLVLPGVTGLVHPDRDLTAMADAYARLASDRAHTARLGAAARRHVAPFTPTAAADGIVRALDRATAGAAR